MIVARSLSPARFQILLYCQKRIPEIINKNGTAGSPAERLDPDTARTCVEIEKNGILY